jgi:peroxiredoxin
MHKIILLGLVFLLNSAHALEGLKKNSAAPLLALTDLAGKSIDFSKEKKKSVLVFYRGSWCPYCMKQLKSIQKDIIGKLGSEAQLIAISVDSKKVAKKMKRNFGLDFRVISDPKAKSLKAFNIVNQLDGELVKKYKSAYKIDVEGDSGEVHHMVAHPAVFVIQNGKVLFADVHTDYKVRTKNSDILKALQ